MRRYESFVVTCEPKSTPKGFAPMDSVEPKQNGKRLRKLAPSRLVLSVITLTGYQGLKLLLVPVSAIESASIAAKQMENSNSAYVTSTIGMGLISPYGVPLFLLMLGILATIWWAPIRRFIGLGTAVAALIFGLHPDTAYAYYDKSDYTEAYTILHNETAFWVPDVGAKIVSQAVV